MIKKLASVFLKYSLVVVSVSLSNSVLAQSTPSSSPNNGYPADFGPEYLKACANNAKSQGVKPEMIDAYCSCTLTKLQSKMSFERMREIMAKTQETRKPSPEIQEIFKSCKK